MSWELTEADLLGEPEPTPPKRACPPAAPATAAPANNDAEPVAPPVSTATPPAANDNAAPSQPAANDNAAGPPKPDRAQAERFIEALTGSSDTPVTFQTFRDDQNRPELARVIHGTLDECWDRLVGLNESGQGIFTMANAGDFKGRSAGNVTALRSLFSDDDGRTPPLLYGQPPLDRLPPSLTVQSKRGQHQYWLTLPGEPLEAFTPAQAGLAARFGTDPQVTDLPRVMRLPGFLHQKAKPGEVPQPYLVTVVQTNEARYTIAQVLEAYGITAPKEAPRASSTKRDRGGEDPTRPLPADFRERLLFKSKGSRYVERLLEGKAVVLPRAQRDLLKSLKRRGQEASVEGDERGGDAAWTHVTMTIAEAIGTDDWISFEQLWPLLEPSWAAEQKGGYTSPTAEDRIRSLLDGARDKFTPSTTDTASTTSPPPGSSSPPPEPELMWPRECGPVEIVITPDEASVVDQVVGALVMGAVDLYQRGGQLVAVAAHDGAEVRGFRIPQGTPRIVPLSASQTRELITQRCTLKKQTGVRSHPPEWSIAALRGRGKWPGIRHLVGIVEAPTLRPDGTLLTQPGYDRHSGLYLAHGAPEVAVPEAPTQGDAFRALGELLDVVVDFPFATPAHATAWAGLVLTLVARHVVDGCTPLFLLDGSTAGSGKSLLADVASTIASGRAMPRRAYSPLEEEQRKSLTTVFLDGIGSCLFDNVANGSALGSPHLDRAITGRTWQDRVLGKSEATAVLPNNTVLLASGNNLSLDGDLHRRVLPIRLEPREERPEERSGFKHPDLLRWVRSERPRLLGAALTLMRAYTGAGRPSAGLKTWGTFEEWSDLMRGSIVWAGGVDPHESRKALFVSQDAGTGALSELLQAMRAADPQGRGATAAQLLNGQHTRGPLTDLVGLPPERQVSSKQAGKALGRWRSTVAGGLRLRRRPAGGGVYVWAADEVTP